MFDSTDPMRHLPFFSELAELDEDDDSWRGVSAGLVLVRLVDAWMQEGCTAVAADGWGVRSVSAAIEEMPAGTPSRAILMSCLDSLQGATIGDMHAVAPRLMAYARSLELDAKWALAVDVYDTVIAHTNPTEEPEIAVNALLRRAYSLQEIGEFADAKSALQTAGALARHAGDMMAMLRARIAEARLTIVHNGNLPAADRIYADAIAIASEHDLVEVRSMATHGRAVIALSRGQYDLSVRLGYDALQESTRESERDRILNDLAGAFYLLGVRSAARDAFLILASTAQEQYLRWLSSINLMELAAADGMGLQFERYRQVLSAEKLPPDLKTQFQLHAGAGYRELGDPVQAHKWFERALSTATAYSLNRFIFAAEKQLSELQTQNRRSQTAAPIDIPRDIQAIATELAERRRSAGVA